MKKLVLFFKGISLLDDKGVFGDVYGFLSDSDELSRDNTRHYMRYLHVSSRLNKEGWDTPKDIPWVMVKAGKAIVVNSPRWKEMEDNVSDDDIQYVMVDADELDLRDEDFDGNWLVNKESWEALIEKKRKVILPMIIFKDTIPTGRGQYHVEGMLLGRNRECPYLTEWEVMRLKQLAATGDWIRSGGVMGTNEWSGEWLKDNIVCLLDDNYVRQFCEEHYKSHKVFFVQVEVNRDWKGCCGQYGDILGSPWVADEIRHWIDEHYDKWLDIDELISMTLDVRNANDEVIKLNYDDDELPF